MVNRKQFGLLIALALGAGFVGGLVGSFLFTGEMVFAQKTLFKEVIPEVILDMPPIKRTLGCLVCVSPDTPMGTDNLIPNGEHIDYNPQTK